MTSSEGVWRTDVRAAELAGGVRRLLGSRVSPEDHFCEAVRNDLRVPLMVEGIPGYRTGHPRT